MTALGLAAGKHAAALVSTPGLSESLSVVFTCCCWCLRPTHRECLRPQRGSQAGVVDRCNVRRNVCSQVGTSIAQGSFLTSAVADASSDPPRTSRAQVGPRCGGQAFRWYAKCSFGRLMPTEPWYDRKRHISLGRRRGGRARNGVGRRAHQQNREQGAPLES